MDRMWFRLYRALVLNIAIDVPIVVHVVLAAGTCADEPGLVMIEAVSATGTCVDELVPADHWRRASAPARKAALRLCPVW